VIWDFLALLCLYLGARLFLWALLGSSGPLDNREDRQNER
jgi:hypothetical protein